MRFFIADLFTLYFRMTLDTYPKDSIIISKNSCPYGLNTSGCYYAYALYQYTSNCCCVDGVCPRERSLADFEVTSSLIFKIIFFRKYVGALLVTTVTSSLLKLWKSMFPNSLKKAKEMSVHLGLSFTRMRKITSKITKLTVNFTLFLFQNCS